MFADDLTLLRASRADAVVASLPTIAYAIGAIGGLRVAAYAGIGTAIVVSAIAARRRPMPAAAGLVGVLFAVGIAVVTGRPTAFFLPGILLNAAFAIAGGFSLAVRKPIFAFTLATIWPRFSQWRTDPAIRRIGAAITAVWTAVFLLRFAVMGGCYLAGAGPSVLAVVKIVLGLPIAAIALAMSLRFISADTGATARPQAAGDLSGADPDDDPTASSRSPVAP